MLYGLETVQHNVRPENIYRSFMWGRLLYPNLDWIGLDSMSACVV